MDEVFGDLGLININEIDWKILPRPIFCESIKTSIVTALNLHHLPRCPLLRGRLESSSCQPPCLSSTTVELESAFPLSGKNQVTIYVSWVLSQGTFSDGIHRRARKLQNLHDFPCTCIWAFILFWPSFEEFPNRNIVDAYSVGALRRKSAWVPKRVERASKRPTSTPSTWCGNNFTLRPSTTPSSSSFSSSSSFASSSVLVSPSLLSAVLTSRSWSLFVNVSTATSTFFFLRRVRSLSFSSSNASFNKVLMFSVALSAST